MSKKIDKAASTKTAMITFVDFMQNFRSIIKFQNKNLQLYSIYYILYVYY